MNKNFKAGAEDVGTVAEKVFNQVGNELKGVGEDLKENAKDQHRKNGDIIDSIKEMTFGFGKESISNEGKVLLISALRSIIKASFWPSVDASEEYYKHFYSILDVTPLQQFDPEKLKHLGAKDAEYILYFLLEYKAFFNKKAALSKVDDIVSHINISPNRRKEFELYVKETVRDVGLEGILNRLKENAAVEKNKRLEKSLEHLENVLEEERRKNEVYRDQVYEAERIADEKDRQFKDGQSKLEEMEKAAKKAVKIAAATAGGIGGSPIPFSDAPFLIGIQVVLMANIAVIFKIDIKKDGLNTLVFAALGIGGAPIIGKTIVANLLKFIPGIGTIVGGAISAATAAIITYAIGCAFINICKDAKLGRLGIEDITSEKGKNMFKEYFKSFAKKKAKKLENFDENEI